LTALTLQQVPAVLAFIYSLQSLMFGATQMKKISLWIFVLSFLATAFPLATYAYSLDFQSHIEGDNNNTQDRPSPNNSPHNVLTLRGRKDPSLELWLGVQYVTTNDRCRTRSAAQAMAGAPAVEQSVGDFVRLPSGESEFSVQFFLDRYVPGRCGWRAVGIEHAQFVPGQNSDSISLSGVATIRDDGVDELKADWICQQKAYSLKGTGPLPLHLSCVPQNSAHKVDRPISIDGGAVDVDFQLKPGIGH
jgi:hypothetical protein